MIFLNIFGLLLVHQATSQLYEGDQCTDTRMGSPGRCCPVHACRSAVEDLQNRNGPPTLCSFAGNTPVVCCRRGCGADTTEGNPHAKRRSELMCAQFEKMVAPLVFPGGGHKKKPKRDHSKNQPPRSRRASIQAGAKLPPEEEGSFFTAAVGGENTALDEFPHMAALGWPRKSGNFAFNCGGSLISERYVLTAGHCLSNARDTTLASSEPSIVRLGDQNILDSIIDGAQPLDVPISRRIKHPNYKPPAKYYDIALLRLKNAVPLSEHIKPACLWSKQDFGTHTTAIVTGWGTTVSGGREGSAVLQKVKVDILKTEVCQPLLRSSHNRNWQGFGDEQLCAGVLAGGKDACQGDSGGPLQVKAQKINVKQYHIIGVTSFGRECGKPNLPGVYTRVSSFVDWIESVVWPQ